MDIITNAIIVENLKGLVTLSISDSATREQSKVYSVFFEMLLIPDISVSFRVNQKVTIFLDILQRAPMNKEFSTHKKNRQTSIFLDWTSSLENLSPLQMFDAASNISRCLFQAKRIY